MTQNISTVRRKKMKKEKEGRRKRKREIKMIKMAIVGILHTSHHILSSIICHLYVYMNYFILIIYYCHGNWFIGL